jgi:hypothetical protein
MEKQPILINPIILYTKTRMLASPCLVKHTALLSSIQGNDWSTYLVVDHQMHRSPRGVVRQAAQIQGLIHNALPAEGAVSMKEDGDVLAPA